MGGQAVLIGIDGVRFDTLAEVATPHLDAVAARGSLAPVQVEGPTISGPCWATMATGVTAHGIIGNEIPSADLPDDFLTVANRTGLRSVAVAGWHPLVRAVDCGPIFRDAGTVILPPDPGDALAGWDAADQFVAEAAAANLTDADIAFVYLGLADEVAHARGVGPEYRAAIEACDRRLGLILAALDGDATVLVATDHGHVDAGGHGGDSDAERTAWIGGYGPGWTGPIARQADIYRRILEAVGVAAP